MNIHEYQAKALLKQYQISVPRGGVAESIEDVQRLAKLLDGQQVVVKAQIHAGSRATGGGVKFIQEGPAMLEYGEALLGKKLVTPGCSVGRIVNKLLFEESIAWERALYLSLLVDRARASIVLTASAQGGVEIERAAKENPKAILKLSLDPVVGYQPYQGRALASSLGLPKAVVGAWVSLLAKLYRLFVEKDAMQIEINPLVLTTEGTFMALDAKMSFDDNALFRMPEIRALRDITQEDPIETEAAQWGFYYLKLEGSVGCMVNGGGLAMATLDLLTRAGIPPANFMDLGGGAPVERIKNAFRMLLGDPLVKSVFVNVFGGLSQCHRIAQGILDAVAEKPDLRQVMQKIPIVVRLEGTHAEDAKALLRASGLPLFVVESLREGIQSLIAVVRGRSEGEKEGV